MLNESTYCSFATKFLLSSIFLLSALGKFINLASSASSLAQLTGLTSVLANVANLFWSIGEVGLAILIWRQKLSRVVLFLPLLLLGITLFSQTRSIDCGCFGSLPYFSQFTFGGHLLLLIGMFLGLYYLTTTSKVEKATPETKVSQTAKLSETPSWTGLAGVVMMFSAFLTLPFTSSDHRASPFVQRHH